MANPMGELKRGCLRVDFDRRLKLEIHGSKVAYDGGLLAYRELDGVLSLTDMAGNDLLDPRTGKNGQHRMTGLFHQSVTSRSGGYDEVNDADRLGCGRDLRWIVGGRAVADKAASTHLSHPAERAMDFYNQRGTAEQHIKEGQNAPSLKGYHAGGSATAQCGSSFIPWLTIWPTSCRHWPCRRKWNIGRRRHYERSW